MDKADIVSSRDAGTIPSSSRSALALRLLRGWEFSVGEYVRDAEKVLDDAVRQPGCRLAGREAVRGCLHFLFMRKVEESLRWDPFPEPVLFGDAVSLVYDGREYRAIVRSGRREMEVILDDRTSPTRRMVAVPEGQDSSFTDDQGVLCPGYGLRTAMDTIIALVLERHYLCSK